MHQKLFNLKLFMRVIFEVLINDNISTTDLLPRVYTDTSSYQNIKHLNIITF